jgi:hypothetical protein
MTSVGHVRLEQRKYAQAEVILREASSAYEKVGTETWNRYRCESVLGAVLSAQKKHAEAETRLISGFEGLVRLRANIPAAERGLVANTAASLEELYRASGKPQEAAEWRAKAKSTD